MTVTTKVTISLPDELVDFADKLAAEARRPRSQIIAALIEERRSRELRERLAEGYRYYAEENRRFAEAALPLAAEIWDEYDWDFEEDDTRETVSRDDAARS